MGGRAANGKRYPASTCHDCHRAESRAYRAANLEVVRERERNYARANAEQKRQLAREWYANNRERAKATASAAYRRDPEYTRDRAHMARARKAGAEVVEFVRRRTVYERDGGICHVCSEPIEWAVFQMDHVIPLGAEGSSHTYENVKASHRACNFGRRRRPSAMLSP